MQAVTRVAAVMNALSASSRPLSVLEIADYAGLDRAVVHRLVRALIIEGLVDRTDNGRYQMGARVMVYASSYVDGLAVRRVGLPYALELKKRLSGAVPIVVSLNVRVGAEMTVVDAVWDDKVGLDSILQIGTRFPVESSSTGRCVLAYLPIETQEELLGDRLDSRLSARLAAIREAGGVDSTHGDMRPGVSGLAATIFDAGRHPVAAMSIYAPDPGMPGLADPGSAHAVALRRTVDAVGFALGGARAQATFG